MSMFLEDLEPKLSFDDVLPFQWEYVFRAFPPEPREYLVRAMAFFADRWIESYRENYITVYGRAHPTISDTDKLMARQHIISFAMYGVPWLDYDKMVSSYLRSVSPDLGHISQFIRQLKVLNPL